ncbi:YwqG family protein [Streptomyces sp. NPDC001700]
MTNDALHDLARAHLPADAARRWTALLRPAAHLRAAEAGEPVVGQLGGLPRLPDDVAWPVWEGKGPLRFVAAVDCAALAALATLPTGELDVPLPTEGRLAFFYYGDEDDDALVDTADPTTWPGARVLHLPPDSHKDGDGDGDGLTPYPAVPLTARIGPSAPDTESPVLDGMELPDAFERALWEYESGTAHQIGGHPQSIQGAVESVVAHGALGGGVAWEDPRIEEEARRWVLLAQFDSDEDADLMWGDGGALYWLIRPDDLAAGRFDQAMFTWQCC